MASSVQLLLKSPFARAKRPGILISFKKGTVYHPHSLGSLSLFRLIFHYSTFLFYFTFYYFCLFYRKLGIRDFKILQKQETRCIQLLMKKAKKDRDDMELKFGEQLQVRSLHKISFS